MLKTRRRSLGTKPASVAQIGFSDRLNLHSPETCWHHLNCSGAVNPRLQLSQQFGPVVDNFLCKTARFGSAHLAHHCIGSVKVPRAPAWYSWAKPLCLERRRQLLRTVVLQTCASLTHGDTI